MQQITGTVRNESVPGLQWLAHRLRRFIVGAIAAVALILAYGVSTIGAQVASTIGIAGLSLATTAEPAQAAKRRGRRGGRRRQGRRRRRGRRGGKWYWYWAPYWYYW